MAGAFEFLDNLSQQVGQVLGKAVDAAGTVATAKITQEQQRATVGDQTPVGATSPLQTARPGFVIDGQTMLYAGAALALVVGAVLFLRKR